MPATDAVWLAVPPGLNESYAWSWVDWPWKWLWIYTKNRSERWTGWIFCMCPFRCPGWKQDRDAWDEYPNLVLSQEALSLPWHTHKILDGLLPHKSLFGASIASKRQLAYLNSIQSGL